MPLHSHASIWPNHLWPSQVPPSTLNLNNQGKHLHHSSIRSLPCYHLCTTEDLTTIRGQSPPRITVSRCYLSTEIPPRAVSYSAMTNQVSKRCHLHFNSSFVPRSGRTTARSTIHGFTTPLLSQNTWSYPRYRRRSDRSALKKVKQHQPYYLPQLEAPGHWPPRRNITIWSHVLGSDLRPLLRYSEKNET